MKLSKDNIIGIIFSVSVILWVFLFVTKTLLALGIFVVCFIAFEIYIAIVDSANEEEENENN